MGKYEAFRLASCHIQRMQQILAIQLVHGIIRDNDKMPGNCRTGKQATALAEQTMLYQYVVIRACVYGDPAHQPSSFPENAACFFTASITSLNCSGVRDCAPSDSAFAGLL